MSDASSVATSRITDGVLALSINSPPVNALGHAVRVALHDGIGAGIADPDVRAIVITCEGRTFFAGADISEFGGAIRAPDLNTIFEAIEASPKPVIAAIHGTALGGGMELALACHYRVAMPSAKLGLPEVSLGLLPGAGGTQRLPRLAGFEVALDLIVTGRAIGAKDALSLGIVDALIEGDLIAGAAAFAREAAASGKLPRVRDRAPALDSEAAAALTTDYRTRNAKAFKGFKAPGSIALAIEAATLPFDEGLARERALFLELMKSRESAAQRHLFFAERAAAKIPGLDDEPLPVAKIAVIGAGTMGSGIALAFLAIGLPVMLIDHEAPALERATAHIRETIRSLAAKGRISRRDAAGREALLDTATDVAAVGDADLIVEAVYENLKLKKQVFAAIDAAAKPGAILASNTSFLDLDAIAAATSRPEAVVGMHFFAPANIMRLLEIVRGARSGGPAVATAMALGRRLGKVAVLSGVCDGFIANRAMARRGAAAERLILEGPMPWHVDRVMTDFGFPMGPFAMLDLVGLDVIGWDREHSAGRNVQEMLCEAGRWGQKTGGGYYDYDPARRGAPSVITEGIIRGFATGGVEFTDDEIVERLLYPVVNEGARLIEEGIALRASDINVALVAGYGWPAWTGGPMFWADTVGLPRIVAALERDQDSGPVSPLLRRMAAKGDSFGS